MEVRLLAEPYITLADLESGRRLVRVIGPAQTVICKREPTKNCTTGIVWRQHLVVCDVDGEDAPRPIEASRLDLVSPELEVRLKTTVEFEEYDGSIRYEV